MHDIIESHREFAAIRAARNDLAERRLLLEGAAEAAEDAHRAACEAALSRREPMPARPEIPDIAALLSADNAQLDRREERVFAEYADDLLDLIDDAEVDLLADAARLAAQLDAKAAEIAALGQAMGHIMAKVSGGGVEFSKVETLTKRANGRVGGIDTAKLLAAVNVGQRLLFDPIVGSRVPEAERPPVDMSARPAVVQTR